MDACNLTKNPNNDVIRAILHGDRNRAVDAAKALHQTALFLIEVLTFHWGAGRGRVSGTYLQTAHGWLYLAIVIDLHSRRIIGWSVASSMQGRLVMEALKQALQTRKTSAATIFHSDRGSLYSS